MTIKVTKTIKGKKYKFEITPINGSSDVSVSIASKSVICHYSDKIEYIKVGGKLEVDGHKIWKINIPPRYRNDVIKILLGR